jgi:hypothetical protein
MTAVGPILLALTLAAPTAFFVACFFGPLRPIALALQWLAPIPALLAAIAPSRAARSISRSRR